VDRIVKRTTGHCFSHKTKTVQVLLVNEKAKTKIKQRFHHARQAHHLHTTGSPHGVSYVFVCNDREYEEKKHLFQHGDPTQVAIQEYQMYKTGGPASSEGGAVATNAMVPCPEMEVLQTFGSINGNKILEFLLQNGNLTGSLTT
jgi:hypothetical protein